MIRLAISVEGQTEGEFVKRVLADRPRPFEVEPTPARPRPERRGRRRKCQHRTTRDAPSPMVFRRRDVAGPLLRL